MPPKSSKKKDKRTTTTTSIGTSSAASSPPPSVFSIPTSTSGSGYRASLPDVAPKPRNFERFPNSPDALPSQDGVSKDPLGLTVIHEPDTPPLLDIIFVHGLGGTSWATWAKQGDLDYFWPQKWLPFEPGIRSARLLSFGYNFDYAATWSDPMTSITDVAKDLLYSMKFAKDENLKELKLGEKPIVFIAHSWGGLVVKQAYILGEYDQGYSSIVLAIKAMLFLATPHRGSDLVGTLKRILTASIVSRNSKSYISEFKGGPRVVEVHNELFRHIAPKLKIFSFYETLRTSIGPNKLMVVERDSATLGYLGEISRPLNADHHNICKFDSTQDSNYISVRDVLQNLVATVSSTGQPLSGTQMETQMEKLKTLLAVSETYQEDLEFFRSRWAPGTCDWILSNPSFNKWVDESTEGSALLWLHGFPGSGKSILSSFVVSHLLGESGCVYYFFRFGDKSKSSLSACLRAIALQTAEQLPEFRRVLEDTLFTTTKLEKADAKTIWEKIFLGVLFKTKITKTIYWIIDAIDESDQPRRFLELIQSIAQSSVPIRVLLVSRSTPELILSFDRLSKFVPVAYLPLEDTQKDIQKDIRIYVEKEVQSMHISAEFKSNVVKKMIERANGVFLWVSLVVSEAMECYSQEHLEDTLDTIPSGMEALYQRMESTIIENTGPRYEKLGQIILTWIVCARRPLLVKELEQALQPKFVLQDLNLTLGRVCGQFVVINSTDQVVMVHKTARDYIVATNSALRLDLAEGHEMLFTKCLTLLIENHSSRKSNRQPTSLKDQHLLRYALISWPYHLDMASAQSDGPLLLLSKFLKGNSVLGWIASLAYGNELNALVSSAQSLNLYIRRKRSHYAAVNPWLRQLRELELLESWATDFVKILGKFGRTLTADPTSIYRQIPPFCPENSMIYRQFAKSTSPPHLSVEGVSKLIWDDSMAKLSLGPGCNNRTVICSGELFAVLTAAGVIVLSSSVTFDILHSLSHTERVSAMSFSTCSNMLVTYGFRTTKVWSVKTGHIIYQIQNPLGSRALTIAFSAENTELVMGSDDGSIRVARLTIASPAWSVSHQRLLKDDTDSDRQIFNRPRCMSFNSDVSCVAITFRGAPLCVWGLDPQELIGKCIGNQEHEGTSWKAVEQVLWHPNSEEVQVLGLYVGGDIFRWNPYFNTPQELQAHASILALSPEGNVFATGDHNGTIKLYDFHNFALIYQLSYADMINDICFSPDSKRLYDVRGQFCNIWEPQVLIRIDGTSEEDSGYGSEMPSVSSIIDLQQPRDPITALAIQFRGRYHAIGNAAGIVSVVDSLEGNGVAVELWRSQTMLPIEHLGWSGDGNYLACVETGGRIVIIHLQLRSDHQLGSFHTQPIAARPTDPKMSSKGIKQILLNSDGKALLVKYGPVTILSQIVNGTRIDEKSITSPDMKWFKHPTYSTLLLAFSPSILQVHRWDDLSTVAVFNMDEHSTSVIQRSQHTKEAPGDVRISSVFTDPAGSRFLMDVVVETSRGEAHFTSSFVESIFLKQPTGRNPVSIITPIPIPPEVQQRIERPLGILPSKGLIFLDKDYWVCSWGDSKPGAEIIQRHFFLPKDWLNEECVDLCALLADGTFLIPHDGDLALIKSAGMLLHMDRPHKGKKNTEDTMKTEDAPMSRRGEKNTRDMIEMELPLVSYTETGTAEDTMETEPAPGLVLEPPVKSDVDEGCENEDPIIRQESTDPHITSPQSVVACESYQEIAPTHFASEAFVSEAVLELMPELSGAFVKDESTGPDDHLTKGDCSSGKLAEVLEVVDTNSGSSTGQSWENLAELNESQSMIENRLLDGHLLVMRNKIHKRIARYLRPRVKAGYRRLEWQCDCGAPLYGDFDDSDPTEVEKLAQELQASGCKSDEQDSHGVKSVPAGQSPSTPGSTVPETPQSSSASQVVPGGSADSKAALPASGSANPGLGNPLMATPPPQRPPSPATKKFIALCVSTGEFNKTLGEIEVSSICTDRQMFHKFKETYQTLRGFRAGAIRWFLIRPVDIQFIQFAVEDSHRVDIIPKPPDCTLCASETDIRSRQYEPHLYISPRTHPPISPNAFLHYWQCHLRERSLQKTKWLNRLPKKLGTKLEDVRRSTPTDDDVLGWGILVVEGLNTALVTLLTFLMLILSGVISVVYSIWRNDVSGGFAIGAYIAALWAALITALYFQWKRE